MGHIAHENERRQRPTTLFALLFVVSLCIDSTYSRPCEWPQDINVTHTFLKNVYIHECTEIKGNVTKGNAMTSLRVTRDVQQEDFDAFFGKITKITGFWKIGCYQNEHLTSFELNKLASLDGLRYVELLHCPNVVRVSFGDIISQPKPIIRSSGMHSWTADSVTAIKKTFTSNNHTIKKSCEFPRDRRISDVSVLSKCKTMSYLEFAKNVKGRVDTTITRIEGHLLIVDTKLDDLAFLQLEPRTPKNPYFCKIVENKLCSIDNMSGIFKMINMAYERCTISINQKRNCSATSSGSDSQSYSPLLIELLFLVVSFI